MHLQSLPICLEIAHLLYLETRAHQWPRKLELLELPFWNGRVSYAAAKGASLRRTRGNQTLAFRFTAVQTPFTTEKRYAAARVSSRLRAQDHLLHLFVAFSALVLCSIVSFLFIPISPCSMKHYSIGDYRNISEYECESCKLSYKDSEIGLQCMHDSLRSTPRNIASCMSSSKNRL